MNKNFIKYICAMILFGSNGIVASNINLASYEIVLCRTAIGSVLLIALFFLSKQEASFIKHKKDLLYITLSGISMGASWVFLYEAYAEIGVSLASLTYYCGPVIVMALSPLVFKEKLSSGKILGFLAVMAGILLLNGNSVGDSINSWGFFCGLMSAATYSSMVILNKRAQKIQGLENAMIQLFSGFITVAIFVGFKSGFNLPIEKSDLIWILVLGVLNTGVGCYLYFFSIGHLPVQTVAVFGYLEPLSAVAFAVLILKEVMLPLQIIGAILIIGGAIFSEFFGSGKKVAN